MLVRRILNRSPSSASKNANLTLVFIIQNYAVLLPGHL